jgi:flagellar assembly protein FliH
MKGKLCWVVGVRMPSSKRIIRSLEAKHFQTLQFESIGSPFSNPVERLLGELCQGKNALPLTPAKPLSAEEQKLQSWEEALHQREHNLNKLEQITREAAHTQGLEQGYQEGFSNAQAERQTLAHLAQMMQSEFEQLKNQLAQKILDLAVLATRKVLTDTIEVHPEATLQLLHTVLEQMQLEPKNLTLKAHPNTLHLLQNHFKDNPNWSTLQWHEDPQLQIGGFVLHHAAGAMDATIEKRWHQAMASLGVENP